MEMRSYNQGELCGFGQALWTRVSAGKSGRKMPRLERGTETQGDSPVPAPGRGP
jgi:hypothetical protein